MWYLNFGIFDLVKPQHVVWEWIHQVKRDEIAIDGADFESNNYAIENQNEACIDGFF